MGVLVIVGSALVKRGLRWPIKTEYFYGIMEGHDGLLVLHPTK